MNKYEDKYKGMWTVEWNQNQEKFHIETADTRFRENTEDYLKDKPSEWCMLGVFNSYKEASEFSGNLNTYKNKAIAF